MQIPLVVILILSTLSYCVRSDVTELQHESQNKSYLDPINDGLEDNQESHDHDKRTIFKPHLHNVAWAKHVGIAPDGRKVVLGISPVDLKLSPVIRPLALRPAGYSYAKPDVRFKLKRPVLPLHPKPTVVKPVLKPKPVYGPPTPGLITSVPATPVPVKPVVGLQPPHLDIIHNEPVPHVDHVHQGDTHLHHLHHHGIPVNIGVQQIPHIHFLGQAHVDQVHQIQVPHGDHLDTFGHIDHIHQVPGTINPIIPIAPATPLKPFVPSPALFEVTKPNLGVLPFGAVFQTPVLKGFPGPHFHFRPGVPAGIPVAQPVPVAPALPTPPLLPAGASLPVGPVAPPHLHHLAPPHLHPVAPPHLHPVAPPHLHRVAPSHFHPLGFAPLPPVTGEPLSPVPHPGLPDIPAGHAAPFPHPIHIHPPGTAIEYHGTRHVLPVNGQWPILPHTPVNALQPVLPPQQPAIPHEQHDVQTPFLPANHPHFQQQLIGSEGEHVYQQQDLSVNQYPNTYQAFPEIQQFQPHEAIQQAGGFEENYEYDQNNAIQPGQSDLQFPLALPQHPFLQNRDLNGGNFQEDQQNNQIVRPSITLEPPFEK